MKKAIFLLATILLLANLTISAQSGPLSDEEQNYLAKGYRVDNNGWIFLHLEGKPYEIGFQRGYLTAAEINEFRETERQFVKYNTSRDYDFFVKKSGELFKKKISKEYVDEMQGMVAGMTRAGHPITYEEILFLNGIYDIKWYWWPKEKDKSQEGGPGCSAFIATGKETVDGKIVMAHNSWFSYAEGKSFNIVVDLYPEKGNRILMQTCGPMIYSGSDFFITGAGLMGTETTIGFFKGHNDKGTPVFERARKAMQYARTIDEWADIMIKNNSGAYANSWLLGDINTNEIACLELGLKHHSLEKKSDGFFVGSNVTGNPQILHDEANGIFDDIRFGTVSRQVRWKELMKENFGKIDVETAKTLLGDHYDTYLRINSPGTRTICGHGELENGLIPNSTDQAFYPSGAYDGKVVTSGMARDWKIWAKWGQPCGSTFNAAEFLKMHPQYEWQEGVLKDIPNCPWTVFPLNRSN